MSAEYFTSMGDLVRGFASAMNLIDPEIQNHHERVAYLAFRLAEEMGLPSEQRRMTFFAALLHDVGGVLSRGELSLKDLEKNARMLAASGAVLLKLFPATAPLSDAVQESQTPWRRLRGLGKQLLAPQHIGQIVHLADAVSLLLNEKDSVLNQIARIQEELRRSNAEFSPTVLAAFDRLAGREYVWMDLLYRPQRILDYLAGESAVSLDETISLTGFMSKVIDFRSPFTAMHSAGVAATAVSLARLVGMSEDECKMMRIAGNLHDVGKLKIPNSILEKPGKLTDEEFNVMKEHAYYTYVLLKDIRGFEQITQWAAYHHEKLTGSGYPFHLQEHEIPLGSRIMAVADIFSAITEDRPYRKGMAREQVISILREDAERGQLSSTMVELLVAHFDEINARREEESRLASKSYQESLTR